MTKRLEVALAEVANLPPDDQDALADWLLEEIRSERRWAKAFGNSADALARLADEALRDDSGSSR